MGFEFKRKRFLHNHLRQALNWKQPESISYLGNFPDPRDLLEKGQKQYFDDLDASERKFAVELFEDDWYGCRGKLLKKKESRNPFGQTHTYQKSNPELTEFFSKMDSGAENEAILLELGGLPWTK